MYGTVSQGSGGNAGIVFKFAADGTYSVLRAFNVGDGANPLGALNLDTNGHRFGVPPFGAVP